MKRPIPIAAAALLVAAAVLAAHVTARAEDGPAADEGPKLDYEFYKQRISPIVMRLCGECHANPRERRKVGRHFLRPLPGRKIRERHHEKNFETLSELIVPGNPAASLYLLKPIGTDAGGVTHKGGVRLRGNMVEYGTIVDWINGAVLPPPPPYKPPESPEGQPDFKFYLAKIAPTLHEVCIECHAGKGKGRFGLVTHPRGDEFPLEDHYKNFETVLKLLKPGQPMKSDFLRKPLPEDAGGRRHKGGDRFVPDDRNHRNWVDFINGVRGPEIPSNEPQATPVLTTAGLAVQAELLGTSDDYDLVEHPMAEGDGAVATIESGVTLRYDFIVQDEGRYRLLFRTGHGLRPLRWAFDDGELSDAALPPLDAPADDFVDVGPVLMLDHATPLLDVRGEVRFEDDRIVMDAHGTDASWLSPENDIDHNGVEAHVTMPDEENGGDDALVLFDMVDGQNGKVAGLTDGGRRFVIGVMEAGEIRILGACQSRPSGRAGPMKIKVEHFAGVAVASLDGSPHVFANLSNRMGQGHFGFLTHGKATVHRLIAIEQFEVYRVKPQMGSIVELKRGRHRLWIELPEGAGMLDSLRIVPADTR